MTTTRGQTAEEEQVSDFESVSSQTTSTSSSTSSLTGQRRNIFQVTEGHRSNTTAYEYGNYFDYFLDYVRIHDLDVLLDLGRDALQQLVMKYTRSLRDNPDKKYSRSTVNGRISAVLYFLDNNDIELNRRMIRRYFPSDESTHDDRPYTHEEIQRILDSGIELRTKVVVLLMVSTGVRIGALHTMQIGDLTPVSWNSNHHNLYKIQVYARTRHKYYTFCTPECYDTIQEYLKYRERCGEELNDKSPLFRKHFNKNDPFTINVPKFLSARAVVNLVDEALKQSGVKTTEARRSHAFRKNFKTVCEESGMKSLHVEMLMGHKEALVKSYMRPKDAELIQDFMTHAVDALTIDPTKRLEKENQELKAERDDEIARLKWREGQQAQEIAELRAQLKEVESQTKGIADLVGWVKTYYDPRLGRRMQIGSADQTPKEAP